MKLKKVLLFHGLPIAISIGLVALVVAFTSPIRKTADKKKVIVQGASQKTRGFHANLLTGYQAELNFIASIKNKDQLTIFGSSEFSESPIASYYFLPDSVGIKTLGIGHAFHQELSILCELLAANEYVEGSKICIIISPSWFESPGWVSDKGTNIEAFIEFVRPNFLDKIANDNSIDDKYKIHIGEYLDRNFSAIDGVSHSMNSLRDLYLDQNNSISSFESVIRRKIMGNPDVTTVKYDVLIDDTDSLRSWGNNYDQTAKRLQSEFLKMISNNKIFVNDTYFSANLAKPDGEFEYGQTKELDLSTCHELRDFNLLIEYLAEKKVDCSFIIQPLNPYYYKDLDRKNELNSTITTTLDNHDFPYLNMFVSSKEAYEPGTLKDIMHLGDYGWMKINKYLDQLYHD